MHGEKRNVYEVLSWTGTAQSVQRLAKGWTFLGSNLGREPDFPLPPGRPWGPPSLLHNGYRVFPGVNWPGRSVDNPPHLVLRSKKE
jgi:hypothetical protein